MSCPKRVPLDDLPDWRVEYLFENRIDPDGKVGGKTVILQRWRLGDEPPGPWEEVTS